MSESPRAHSDLNPHPEEHCEAMRLEGCGRDVDMLGPTWFETRSCAALLIMRVVKCRRAKAPLLFAARGSRSSGVPFRITEGDGAPVSASSWMPPCGGEPSCEDS